MEITRQLTNVAEQMGVKFTLNNKPISYAEVFADTGLLPAMARRADQLCSLCFGYGLGASFDEAEKTILGVRVTFDETTPNVLRLMCLTDVLFELKQASPQPTAVSLDELLYD